jgi:methionine-rich copper-binding protein CopC
MIPWRDTDSSQRRRARRLVARFGTVVAVAVVGFASPASAHDGIASSDPKSGSQVDDPIDEVLIDFGTTIGDDTEIVVFDPDDDLLDTASERVSDTEAVVTFDPIDESGTYIVRYLASSIQDGHVLAGAISFSYGSGSSGPSLAMILYLAGAVVVLAIGAWLSYRRYRAGRDDDGPPPSASEVDEDLSDVGV